MYSKMTFSASRSKKCPPSAMPSRPFSMMRKNGSSAVKSSRSVIGVVMMGPVLYVHAGAVLRETEQLPCAGDALEFASAERFERRGLSGDRRDNGRGHDDLA